VIAFAGRGKGYVNGKWKMGNVITDTKNNYGKRVWREGSWL